MDFRPGRARVRLGNQEKMKLPAEPPVDPTAEAITGAVIRACAEGRIKVEILPTSQTQPQVQPQPPVVVVNGSAGQQVSEPAVEEVEPEPVLPEPPEDSFFNRVRGKR